MQDASYFKKLNTLVVKMSKINTDLLLEINHYYVLFNYTNNKIVTAHDKPLVISFTSPKNISNFHSAQMPRYSYQTEGVKDFSSILSYSTHIAS